MPQAEGECLAVSRRYAAASPSAPAGHLPLRGRNGTGQRNPIPIAPPEGELSRSD